MLFFLFLVRWDWVSWYCGHYWPIVPASDDRRWWLCRYWWNEDWQGKLKYSEKTCPSGTLSTTNPTWLDLDLNPGRRCGKPATNRFSCGVAWLYELYMWFRNATDEPLTNFFSTLMYMYTCFTNVRTFQNNRIHIAPPVRNGTCEQQ
jgi:hypothetical protein